MYLLLFAEQIACSTCEWESIYIHTYECVHLPSYIYYTIAIPHAISLNSIQFNLNCSQWTHNVWVKRNIVSVYRNSNQMENPQKKTRNLHLHHWISSTTWVAATAEMETTQFVTMAWQNDSNKRKKKKIISASLLSGLSIFMLIKYFDISDYNAHCAPYVCLLWCSSSQVQTMD